MNILNLYPEHTLATVSPEIMGHFVEQFPGNIPYGIYDPQHPLADEDGFRSDLIAAMREVRVTQLRWAGNFSSTYHWRDGVGPRDQRPCVKNIAWNTIEDNAHGTAEFIKLCRKVGAEPIIGVNMGSGTAEEAMHWVEYCNGDGPTYFAQLRRSHGFPEPFHVRRWCLGNEMYAAWQFGHLSASAYAEKAEHFAQAMRWADPDIHLTAVGLETDPQWNLEIVRRLSAKKTRFQPGEWINALSAHYYPIGCAGAYEGASYETRMTLGAFFHERTRLMRSAIEAATNDAQSDIAIMWDEWNPAGDRDGTEFTLEMAMWCALILNSFIRDAMYVKAANYTFFIGGNGPVQLTKEGVVRHAEFYTLKLYGELLGNRLIASHGQFPVKRIMMPMDRRWPVNGQPTGLLRNIALIDAVATASDHGIQVFAVNLDREQEQPLCIRLCETTHTYLQATLQTLWHENLHACNSLESPHTVFPITRHMAVQENQLQVTLPPHCVCAIHLF